MQTAGASHPPLGLNYSVRVKAELLSDSGCSFVHSVSQLAQNSSWLTAESASCSAASNSSLSWSFWTSGGPAQKDLSSKSDSASSECIVWSLSGTAVAGELVGEDGCGDDGHCPSLHRDKCEEKPEKQQWTSSLHFQGWLLLVENHVTRQQELALRQQGKQHCSMELLVGAFWCMACIGNYTSIRNCNHDFFVPFAPYINFLHAKNDRRVQGPRGWVGYAYLK